LTGAVVNKAKCKYFYQLALAVKHSLIRSIFVLIILLFITIPGCKKDVIQDNHLTGQWQWEYSEGGYSFHKITPANNSLRLLNFYPNSTFSVTESGNASFNGTFTVTGDTTSGKIIHFISNYFEGNLEAWRALEEAYKAGKLRSIGLSNFEKPDIDNILSSCSVKPMVNQILAHISNTPKDLIEYNQGKDILVEAYSPFGHGELFKNRQIAAIAEKYGVSVSQLAIRYCLELGDPNGEVYTIRNNQLILTDYMIADGFRHYYKRVK
jgi:hypothetical protein